MLARPKNSPTTADAVGLSRTPAIRTGIYAMVMEMGPTWKYPRKENDISSSKAISDVRI